MHYITNYSTPSISDTTTLTRFLWSEEVGVHGSLTVGKMYPFRTIWVENTPYSLFKLTTQYCLKNRQCFTVRQPDGSYRLREGLYLPVEICEALLDCCSEDKICIDDYFAKIFSDTKRTRLSTVSLHNSVITDDGFNSLVVHSLRKISLINCNNITESSLESLNCYSDNLVSLYVEKFRQNH